MPLAKKEKLWSRVLEYDEEEKLIKLAHDEAQEKKIWKVCSTI